MIPERKAEWLQDLRSGKFKQGRKYLHSVDDQGNENFCCLGLISKRAFEAGICTREKSIFGGGYTYVELDGSCSSETGLLPSIMEWLGLEVREDGKYPQTIEVISCSDVLPTTRRSVIYLNDDLKWDFSQIADAVERTF